MDSSEINELIGALRNIAATKEETIAAAIKLKCLMEVVMENADCSFIWSFPADIFLENIHPEVRIMGLDIAMKSKFHTLLIPLARMLEEEKQPKVQTKIKNVMDAICAKSGHKLRTYSSSEVLCIVKDLNEAQNRLNEKMLKVILRRIREERDLRSIKSCKRCMN